MKTWLEHLATKQQETVIFHERTEPNIDWNARLSGVSVSYGYKTRIGLDLGASFHWQKEYPDEYKLHKKVAIQQMHELVFEGFRKELLNLHYLIGGPLSYSDRHKAMDIIDDLLNKVTGRDIEKQNHA